MTITKLVAIIAIAGSSAAFTAPAFANGDEPCDCEPTRVKGNNGLGNGDQPAPGNSGDRNKAENENGNPGHASGKPQNSD